MEFKRLTLWPLLSILILIHPVVAGGAKLPIKKKPQTIVICREPIKLYVSSTYEAVHPISTGASYAYAYVVYASHPFYTFRSTYISWPRPVLHVKITNNIGFIVLEIWYRVCEVYR